jgi:hypothetical protein
MTVGSIFLTYCYILIKIQVCLQAFFAASFANSVTRDLIEIKKISHFVRNDKFWNKSLFLYFDSLLILNPFVIIGFFTGHRIKWCPELVEGAGETILRFFIKIE